MSEKPTQNRVPEGEKDLYRKQMDNHGSTDAQKGYDRIWEHLFHQQKKRTASFVLTLCEAIIAQANK